MQIEPVGRRTLAPPPVMSFDAYCRLIDSLRPPLELHLQGDEEPLLHPRFFDMVAYAVQRGLDVATTTRLPRMSARRAEECVQSGLKRMHVAAGGEPVLVRRGLLRLEEAKRKLGSRLPEVVLPW